ncbi:MAG: hypothetical protein F9Y92_05735 [Thermoplasmatales archaeon]|nr:hypothetical protein [Thermoplasmatales archaeon]
MGYDLCDATIENNPFLNEVYLETILYNNRVYLLPIDPLTTASVEEKVGEKLGAMFSSINNFPAKYKFITLVSLASLAFLFGTTSVKEYLSDLSKMLGDSSTKGLATYYTLLHLMRIRTKHSGQELLNEVIQTIIKQPKAVEIKVGQFFDVMYGKHIFKLNEPGLNLLQKRLSLIAKSQNHIIPVLCVSDADLAFNEKFDNEYGPDPMKSTLNGIIGTMQNLSAWLLFGTTFFNIIAEKMADKGTTSPPTGTDSNDSGFIGKIFNTIENAISSVFTAGARTASGAANSINAYAHKVLIPLMYYTSMQYKISLPHIYTNSERRATVTLNLKLRANSVYEFYDNIVIPLLYLEALALPRKYRGADKILGVDTKKLVPEDDQKPQQTDDKKQDKKQDNKQNNKQDQGKITESKKNLADLLDILPIYGPPFYVSCIIPGKVFIPFGLITDMNVSYDTAGSSMIGGQPTTVKVELTITDMTDIVMYNYDFLSLYT